jgi:hypothetical protein
MKFQSTFSKPLLNRRPKTFRLGFTSTVANPIIRITLKRDLRKIPLHPLVERIMQKEIRKEGTDDSSHTIDNFEFEQTVRYTRVWNKNNT